MLVKLKQALFLSGCLTGLLLSAASAESIDGAAVIKAEQSSRVGPTGQSSRTGPSGQDPEPDPADRSKSTALIGPPSGRVEAENKSAGSEGLPETDPWT